MFNLFAETLELLYRLWDSYGVTIILLTVGIRLLVTPLTVKGTKSMLEMRKVQPEIKKLQAQYKNDRVKLNQELSQLYREHKINPLGGCLPLLVQMPIFLVLYQVIRGLTRRASDVGYALGSWSGGRVSGQSLSEASLSPEARRNFNPDWLDTSDEMYQDLIQDNEMISWGLDLARTPWQILTEDVVRSLPYLALIVLTGVLSYYQQRQIQGRSTGDVNPQQRILMRIIPIFIPIISFNLPTALVIYFLTTSAVGVAQQGFLTRWVYAPHNKRNPERKEANAEGSEIIDIQPSVPDNASEEKPKNLFKSLAGQPAEQQKHGSSPLSKGPKSTPPKAAQKKAPPPSSPPAVSKKQPSRQIENTPKNNKGRKSRKAEPEPEPEQKVSKRITPKKNPNEQLRKKRRYK